MKRIVSILNHKGGVGKTTSAVNISACIGEEGRQCPAHRYGSPGKRKCLPLGVKDDGSAILRALQSSMALPVVSTPAERVDLVPSGPCLAAGHQRFSGAGSVGTGLLVRCLAHMEGEWDWIIIDCPPTLEIFTQNALRVSRYLVVPVEAHYLGLTGLNQMMETVESVGSLNPDIEISAVIPCRAHPRRRIHREIMTELERTFPGKVAPYIRENVALAESPGRGLPYSMRLSQMEPMTSGR
jgi:chromosome partitioning protein